MFIAIHCTSSRTIATQWVHALPHPMPWQQNTCEGQKTSSVKHTVVYTQNVTFYSFPQQWGKKDIKLFSWTLTLDKKLLSSIFFIFTLNTGDSVVNMKWGTKQYKSWLYFIQGNHTSNFLLLFFKCYVVLTNIGHQLSLFYMSNNLFHFTLQEILSC